MRTLEVGPPPGVLLVAAGDEPTLISNQDDTDLLYLGQGPEVNANDPNSSIPLAPTGYIGVSGEEDVWGVAAVGATVQTYLMPTALTFFQPSAFVFDGVGMANYVHANNTQPKTAADTVLVTDNRLFVNLDENSKYELEYFLFFDSNAAVDLRTVWSPASVGWSGQRFTLGSTQGAGGFSSRVQTESQYGGRPYSSVVIYILDTGTVGQVFMERAIVVTDNVPGAMNLQWSKGNAVVGTLNRLPASYLKWTKVA